MLSYSHVHSVIEYQVLSDERDTTPALRMLCLLPAAGKERFVVGLLVVPQIHFSLLAHVSSQLEMTYPSVLSIEV